ncbi:MAG: cobalamin biosynthesis protein [Hyphomicrobiaceae bacterium]|nr:cobalamin biosynthesis protein [Hyphomicrobiaceae bacterium]
MLITENADIILLIALALDSLFGEPTWLWNRFPHPVVLMGRLIAATEKRFNKRRTGRFQKHMLSIIGLMFWIVVAVGIGLTVTFAWQFTVFSGFVILEIIIVAVLIAGRSLYEHVDAVRIALEFKCLREARKAVSAIVGRNSESLDKSAVCRASIESAAENFSDGIVAPALWYLIAGLPGILVYKMINTADSMIGYRTPRYKIFGCSAARLDDVLNLVPARLTALFLIITALLGDFSGFNAFRSVWLDAKKHRSLNAGWPEAAMAGALGLALAGPREYGNEKITDAWMNTDGTQKANSEDILSALNLIFRANCMMVLSIIILIFSSRTS